MELLSVAQKYQMGTALSHIRATVSQQNSLPSGLEKALHIYALAQKYGLRPEALQSARAIFLKHSMTIEDLENKLDIMPCASLYELLEYHKIVRAFLELDLRIFGMTCARETIAGVRCTEVCSRIPGWLYLYIKSIGTNLNLFDTTEFNIAMARHIKANAKETCCECASISSQNLRNFWEALTSVVDGSFKKVSVVDIL
jgi:hypothetical protein